MSSNPSEALAQPREVVPAREGSFMSPLAARSERPRQPFASTPSLPEEPGLIGRRPEINALAALVEQARAGRSGVSLLRGEPRMGKWVLLDVRVRRAQGFVIAREAGVKAGMELAYAAFQQPC